MCVWVRLVEGERNITNTLTVVREKERYGQTKSDEKERESKSRRG